MNWDRIDWPLIGEATVDTLLMTGGPCCGRL